MTWLFSRNHPSDNSSDEAEPSFPLPPQLPAKEKVPSITIPSSSLASDWAGIINKQDHSDVMFQLGAKTFHAHKYFLCASSVFQAIFSVELDILNIKVQNIAMSSMWPKKRLAKVSKACVKESNMQGILSVQTK